MKSGTLLLHLIMFDNYNTASKSTVGYPNHFKLYSGPLHILSTLVGSFLPLQNENINSSYLLSTFFP